jgi:hypothetical protein
MSAVPAWLYVSMCVIVPCLIGLAVYGLFELWDRRRSRRHAESEPVVIEYQI